MGTDFEIPGNFNWSNKPQPPILPEISNGTLFSNEIDTFWLYGGDSHDDEYMSNSIWRFKADSPEGTWAEIIPKAANVSQYRPTHGAGFTALTRATAYFLGGYTKLNESDETLLYHHSMSVFDMTTETMSTFDILHFIPIIDPNLVFLDAGKEGVLVVVGGRTERDGILHTVNE